MKVSYYYYIVTNCVVKCLQLTNWVVECLQLTNEDKEGK